MKNENLQNFLVSALLQEDAYSHAVSKIRLLETHISWIFLTGEYAYKVKKPVCLGFLDFSTQQLRRHFCEEELRLNRRYSDDMYLDVVSIKKLGSAIKVSEESHGEIIEHAVRMRQFSQSDLAIEMLNMGTLSFRNLSQFAETVADFHRQSRLAPNQRADPVEAIRRPAMENFEHLDSVELDDLTHKSVAHLEEWTTLTCNDLAKTFRSRSQQGFVCDCHGDLHLGNIVWWNGKLTPFDCIEFNKQFRLIDVMSEIAFLVMDLEDHLRRDLAYCFLNAYLEQTGDYEGLRVLAFYLVYRSMVRAKVTAIRLQQGHLSRKERNELTHECLGYIRLAANYTEKTPPILAITCGLSGSGKTTGSEMLIREEGFIRIRSDVERKRLFGMGPLARATGEIASGIYSEAANAETEGRLLAAATEILDSGFSVIVDATFLRQEQRGPFMQLANEMGVPFRIYHCEAEFDLLRQRIEKRQKANSDASDATVDVLEHQIEIQEPFTNEEAQFVIRLASSIGPTNES